MQDFGRQEEMFFMNVGWYAAWTLTTWVGSGQPIQSV
jgi:hypothetical protein